jgi:hypothetical protein
MGEKEKHLQQISAEGVTIAIRRSIFLTALPWGHSRNNQVQTCLRIPDID